MKEQIISLDPHDDVISARDKMGWVQTERVLLVWPSGARLLTRELDLVLLHRHAHELGAHLALVTGDEQVRDHARALGLPVFASIPASRRMKWRSRYPRRALTDQRPPRGADALRAERPPSADARPWTWVDWTSHSLVFLLGLAAVLALAYGLIPHATVYLTPAEGPLSVHLTLTADPAAPDITADGIVPARRARIEVEAQAITATSGLKEVPAERAHGQVIFTNLTGAAAAIPVGASIRTTNGGSPARFITLRAVNLEARVGASLEVDVQAVAPGPAGNVAAGQINAVDGPLGLQLAVTNPGPTQGGALAQQAAVTPADLERLRADLTARLQAKALDSLQAQLQPGEFLAAPSVRIERVVAETYNHAAGEIADTVELTLRLALSGLAIDERDARQAAAAALRATTPAGFRLTSAAPQFQRDPAITLTEAGLAQFQVTAAGAVAPEIDQLAVQRLVLHQPLAAAGARLSAAVRLSEPPRLDLRPAWFARWPGRLPALLFRISVVLAAP